MADDREYQKARSRAKGKLSFYFHAVIFAVVNVGLIVHDLRDPDTLWFYWTTLGWGIGLIAHGFGVYMRSGLLDSMTEKEIQKRR